MRYILLITMLLCLKWVSAQENSFNPHYSHNFQFGFGFGGETKASTNQEDLMDGTFMALHFDYVGLYHLNPKVALGAGTGLRHVIWDISFNDHGTYYDANLAQSFLIPVYAQARFRFLDKKVSPFVSPALGYNIYVGSNNESLYGNDFDNRHLGSGFMGNVHAGVSVRFGRGIQLVAGPYFDYFRTTVAYEYADPLMNWTGGDIPKVKSTSEFNLFQGGLKVGLSF